jgi:hypothetical protein
MEIDERMESALGEGKEARIEENSYYESDDEPNLLVMNNNGALISEYWSISQLNANELDHYKNSLEDFYIYECKDIQDIRRNFGISEWRLQKAFYLAKLTDFEDEYKILFFTIMTR